MRTNTMTRDEALDLAHDHYMAGNVEFQVNAWDTNEAIEDVLSPWNIKVAD
jgi:hypothetical protein